MVPRLFQYTTHAMSARPFLQNHYTPSSEPSSWTKFTRTMRKYMHKATKSIMRSHRFQLPKYDMPIRLRPVSVDVFFCQSYALELRTFIHMISLLVVHPVYYSRDAHSRIPRIHQLLSFTSTQRQASPFHMPRSRHRHLLLHIRC